MRAAYDSDISREKFKEIVPLLQSVRRRTKPTTVDLYKVFCAVLYLLRSTMATSFTVRYELYASEKFPHLTVTEPLEYALGRRSSRPCCPDRSPSHMTAERVGF